MGFNMKRTILTVGFILVLAWGLAAPARALAQASPDEKLFQDAKLLLFDKKWEAALAKLQELMDAHAKSPYYGQAMFYKGECLSSLPGRERDALQAYQEYIQLRDANPSLAEKSEGSIIDLASTLYNKGDGAALKEIEGRLGHRNRAVRYYAAYKLSLVPDKAVASKAVPVLEQIIRTEKDPELTDRARIALLRVSPESLKSVEDRRYAREENRILRIRVWKKGLKDPVVSVNLPWSLADLALGAMSDEDKASMRAKGYDINRIMNDLAKSKEKIVRIEAEDGTIIEIWIE
jgi:outer membrane protein assembly factor BamD (BamD/ComL family)